MKPLHLDEHEVKDLARAIASRSADEAFVALDAMIRDHADVGTIRHWIDCGRFSRG